MRKSTVVSLNKFRVFDVVFKNRLLLILYFLFALGVLSGVLCFNKSDTAINISKTVFTEYLSKRSSGSFVSVLCSSAIASFFALLISFLLGASVMGVIVSPIYDFFLGFVYGCVSAHLYSAYSLNGVAFNAIVFIPSTAVMLIALILACKFSVCFSLSIARLTFSKGVSRNLYEEFKSYCRSYLVIAALIVFSSLLDAVLSKMLFKFFDF